MLSFRFNYAFVSTMLCFRFNYASAQSQLGIILFTAAINYFIITTNPFFIPAIKMYFISTSISITLTTNPFYFIPAMLPAMTLETTPFQLYMVIIVSTNHLNIPASIIHLSLQPIHFRERRISLHLSTLAPQPNYLFFLLLPLASFVSFPSCFLLSAIYSFALYSMLVIPQLPYHLDYISS